MKIAFAGTGYINKVHAQAAKNLKLDLTAEIFHEMYKKNKTPVPGGMEGLMNMKVVDAAYKSSKMGNVVEIK